jgi:hypothetical protein
VNPERIARSLAVRGARDKIQVALDGVSQAICIGKYLRVLEE